MLFAGEGWGKTAAALGYAVRASGRGWPATVVQFVKGSAWNEAEASMSAAAEISWPVFSSGMTWGGRDPQELCRMAWREAQRALVDADAGLVVLDEVTRAIEHGWLTAAQVVEALEERNPLTSVILTGQVAPQPLVDAADTVTDFRLAKHEHRSGILAP